MFRFFPIKLPHNYVYSLQKNALLCSVFTFWGTMNVAYWAVHSAVQESLIVVKSR